MDFEEFKQQFYNKKREHDNEIDYLNVKFANEINEFVVVNIEKVFIPDVTMLSYNDRDGEIRYLVLGVSLNTLKLRLGIYYCNGRYCNPYDRGEGETYTIGKAFKELKDATSCLDGEMIEQAIKDDKNKKKERDLNKYREAKINGWKEVTKAGFDDFMKKYLDDPDAKVKLSQNTCFICEPIQHTIEWEHKPIAIYLDDWLNGNTRHYKIKDGD